MLSIACDGDREPDAPVYVEPPALERLPENGARTDPEAPCTTGIPAASGFCALPFEETELEIVSASSSTKDGCTQLYVASRTAGDRVARVRRYRMTGVDVCGFARDEAFGEVRAHLSEISASEDGAVFALGYRVVRRIAPGPPIDCVARDVTLGDRSHLAVSPSGRIGYVSWDDTVATRFAKIITTADGCELTAFSPEPFYPALRVQDLAVDADDRLHILPEREHVPASIFVFDPDGTGLIFDPSDGADIIDRLTAMTPCGAGTCARGVQSRSAFGADGERLAWQRTDSELDRQLGCRSFVGSAGGPLFCLGLGSGHHPGMRAQVIKIP